jgi:predicted nucleic acid-binding protein
MGVVVKIGSQNPRPFGCAQGRLCRKKRDKDGPPSGVEMSERVGQPPIRLVDATSQRAVHAANVKAKYKLYYVDSFAAALAIEYKATLVTSDSDFRKLGHGFPVVWLKA